MVAIVDKIRDAAEDLLKDKKVLIKILTVLLILIIALILKARENSKSDITIEQTDTAETAAQEEEETGDELMYVDISGAVNEPGVYKVAKGTRLFEVIDMAGGLAENADADSVNRASYVEDGQKIIIPEKGSPEAAEGPSSSGITSTGLVNINTASHDELTTLNGIGDVMADRIIEYRKTTAFKSKEDIMSVNGIGSGIYNKIKDDITY